MCNREGKYILIFSLNIPIIQHAPEISRSSTPNWLVQQQMRKNRVLPGCLQKIVMEIAFLIKLLILIFPLLSPVHISIFGEVIWEVFIYATSFPIKLYLWSSSYPLENGSHSFPEREG